MLLFKFKSILSLIILISISICINSCRNTDEAEPIISKEPCYLGKWGNDYRTCPISSTLTQGTGSLADSQAQELKLILNADSTGYFHFYDCQNMKYAEGLVRFRYKVVNNEITFNWQAVTQEQIYAILNEFNYKSTYTFECRGDSLILPRGMLGFQIRYNDTRYFLRR